MTIDDWLSLTGVLLSGLAAGWLLRGLLNRTADGTVHVEPRGTIAREAKALSRKYESKQAALARQQQEIVGYKTRLAKIDAELARYTGESQELQTRLDGRDDERRNLLRELAERRARVDKASGDLHKLDEQINSHEQQKSTSLAKVQEHNRELEMLKQVSDGYQADVDDITQHIQLNDSEVSRLKAVLEAKEKELSDARELLVRQDAELINLSQARKRVEEKIVQAEQQTTMMAREHDRLLDELRNMAEDTDQRARLLLALQHDGHPDAGPLMLDVGYPDPDNVSYNTPLLPRMDEADQLPGMDAGDKLKAMDEGDQLLGMDAGDKLKAMDEANKPLDMEATDDLTVIKGLNDNYATRLNAAGITTFLLLSNLSPEKVRSIIEAPQWRAPDVESWIAEARALASDDEDGFDFDDNDDDDDDNDDRFSNYIEMG